ncbi:peptidyl-alpha-hydroxyglycine alpha-amidating lyase family protein [Paenibacillus vulneris]|uniref:6-bladed beta-propeller n=1 Tax=Paenibacillus vulneris TaxID=1133364 RepID=A0ABW3UU15_9BACL
MASPDKLVRIGDILYKIERPWSLLKPDHAAIQSISHLTVDESGRLYVLRREDPFLLIFAPDGTLLDEWRNKDTDGGHYVHVSTQGNVYIADWHHHRILVYNPQGELLQAIGDGLPGFNAPFNHPTDIATTDDGQLFISDGYGNSNVHHFDAAGNHIKTWGGPGKGPGQFSTPHAIALDGQGRLWVTDRENNRVQLFDLEGTYVKEIGDLYHPMDIFIDRKGLVYVTDQTPRLSVYSPEGELVARNKPASLAHGVAVDPDGIIYLADLSPNLILRLVPLS